MSVEPAQNPIFQRMLERMNYPPPIAQLIGFELVNLELGKAIFELEASERHVNPLGTLHGGILCDLADAAMGTAYASTLQVGETFTTLELKINFLKPIWKAKLTAVGHVGEGGRTVGLLECVIFCVRGYPLARACRYG